MKKLNKFFAVLVALAMMATLCVSMAFANDGDGDTEPTAPSITEEQKSKDAKLVKYLKLAEGVNVPTDNFHFTFKGVETNTITEAEANVVAPTEDVAAIATSDMQETKYASDGATVAKAVSVASLFDLTKFSKPGVYQYTVTEKETNTADKNGGTMSYNTGDIKSYTVSIYVTKDSNGKLQIENIVVQDSAGDKKDATNDPTDKNDPDVTETKDLSTEGFTFINSFTKSKTVDDEDGVLRISKTVTGDMADETLEFPFTVALTIPAEDGTDSVTYYKNNAETGTTTTAEQYNDKVITFDVNLKHGDKIVFKTLPLGTKVSVTENLAKTTGEGEEAAEVVKNHKQWTAKATMTDIETAAQQTAGEKGENYTPAGLLIAENDKKNIAAFENAYEKSADETPTGILISNLPYIALALVAIGGLVAYVVVRRKDEENA